MDGVWTIIIVVGPILLLAALIFGWKKNRDATEWKTRKAERGARELREEIEERSNKKIDL